MVLNTLFYAWLGLKYSFLLWVFFLAVMKLRDVRDAGNLVGPIRYPAFLVLGIGYALDALVNMTVMFVVLWEQPSITFGKGWWTESEWTVSDRTKRWAQTDTWRGALCRWLRKRFLAPADSKGGHD